MFRQTRYLDRHCVLVVLVGGERLALLGGYHCVTGNQLGHDAAHSLNTHGQSCHIQQQHLVCLQKTQSTLCFARTAAAIVQRAVVGSSSILFYLTFSLIHWTEWIQWTEA